MMEEKYNKIDSEEEWGRLFSSLDERCQKHPTSIGEEAQNRSLNRYLNIVPYDKSRVKLQRLKHGQDYINANFVTVPKAARKYILTQGPLPETLGHFWLMVCEQKSSVIVMLNKVLEVEQFVKCEEYWPKAVDETNHYDDVNLSVTLKSVQTCKHYTKRKMVLLDKESNKSRDIIQFQYTAWPDHGHPESPTSLLRLITAVRREGGLYKMDEPTIVHCSAGVGRSGTFCLIDSVLSMVENQGSTEGIDIDSTLIEMRDHRMGLIQSSPQLKFAYTAIIYGIKILEKANKLHPHMSICQDNIAFDNGSQQNRINGSSQTTTASSQATNGKNKSRRNRNKRNQSTNSGSLNIFERNLLADALDDIDSDSADSLFEDAMKPWPNMKKARNSAPEELQTIKDALVAIAGECSDPSIKELSAEVRAEMIDSAMSKLLTNTNKISATINASHASDEFSSDKTSEQEDSALLRRREREIKNQRLQERTEEIRRRMKEEDAKKELNRWSFPKRSVVIGSVAALLLSSVVYLYLR